LFYGEEIKNRTLKALENQRQTDDATTLDRNRSQICQQRVQKCASVFLSGVVNTDAPNQTN